MAPHRGRTWNSFIFLLVCSCILLSHRASALVQRSEERFRSAGIHTGKEAVELSQVRILAADDDSGDGDGLDGDNDGDNGEMTSEEEAATSSPASTAGLKGGSAESAAPNVTKPAASKAPATSAPVSTAPAATSVPNTTAPSATAPKATVSATPAPKATVPATTAPATSAPKATTPAATAPATTVPATTAPATAAPVKKAAAEESLTPAPANSTAPAVGKPTEKPVKRGVAPPKTSKQPNEEGPQDKESSESGPTGPPKLEYDTANWEGMGDPSGKLRFTLVVKNTGGGTLECQIVVPTFMKARPERVAVEGGSDKNVTISVLDPKGMKVDVELIELHAGSAGYQELAITKEMIGQPLEADWAGYPSRTSSLAWLMGASVLGLGSVGACIWVRKRQAARSSFRYHELEMQAADGIDISTTLGQAPLNRGESLGTGTSAKFSLDEEAGSNGWDDNWDDQWDDDDRQNRTR